VQSVEVAVERFVGERIKTGLEDIGQGRAAALVKNVVSTVMPPRPRIGSET
jgi:hypothetical protein